MGATSDLSVLIHTFDGYKHLWPGMALSLKDHWNAPGIPIYWGTDVKPQHTKGPFNTVCGLSCNVIFSDPGEWSDRLRALLKQIPTDYILYCQEDMWLTQSPPYLDGLMAIVQKNDLLRLQISPIVHFYKLTQAGNIHYFNPESKYLVSHQPSIWKKSFLLDSLKPGETPWVNEYKGTLRWQQSSATREYITKKIAIYPCDWFSHKCIKGNVVQ